MLLEDLTEDYRCSSCCCKSANEAIYTFETHRLLEQDQDGETALHYAAMNNELEICKILINRNPNIIGIKDIDNDCLRLGVNITMNIIVTLKFVISKKYQ